MIDLRRGLLENVTAGACIAGLLLGPLVLGAVRAPEFVIVQGLFLFAASVWVIRLWKSRPALLVTPVCWPVLLFVAYALVRYAYADVAYLARREVVETVTYGVLFWVVLNNLHRQSRVEWFALGLITLAAALSVFAIYQFAFKAPGIWHWVKPAVYLERGSGTYINPNHLGGLLEMALPIALSFVLIGRFSHATKVVLAYFSLLIFIGIGVTLSRGAYLSAGVALAALSIVLLFQRAYRLRGAIMLGILLVCGGAFSFKVAVTKERMNQLLKSDARMEGGRARLWAPAYKIWMQEPWLGAGPGHYDALFPKYRPEKEQLRPDFAHNDYLNTLCDWGIVGLVIVLSALVITVIGVRISWPYVRRAPNDLQTKSSNKAAFVMGASCGLLAIALHSIVDFNMHIPANAAMAVAVLALLSSYRRFETERFWVRCSIPICLIITLAVVAASVYLVTEGKRRVDEFSQLRLAAGHSVGSSERIRHLELAFQADDRNYETASAIGEQWRLRSFEGTTNYVLLGETAIKWFTRSRQLNPFDARNLTRLGMSLDWLERHDEAEKVFAEAMALDPNGYATVALCGWHFIQVRKYSEAIPILYRSLQIVPGDVNKVAAFYLPLAQQRLRELDTNSLQLPQLPATPR